jgi:hypothetical protein
MRLIGIILNGKEFPGIIRVNRDGKINLTIETVSGSVLFKNTSISKVVEVLDGKGSLTSKGLTRLVDMVSRQDEV